MLIYLLMPWCGGRGQRGCSGQPGDDRSAQRPQRRVTLLVAGLLLLALYNRSAETVFALTLFTRIVHFRAGRGKPQSIMGYAAMSFGHAPPISGSAAMRSAFLAAEGIGSGFVQWPRRAGGIGAVLRS